jgi:plastocyanin
MRFQPAVLAVKRGDRVVWLNSDVVPHTATAATTAKSFDSSTIAPGASWAMTAKQPGQLDYVCTLHPMMKASLVVKER